MTETTTSGYEQARDRLMRKRKFRGDVVAYVVINAFLVGIWAVDGLAWATSGRAGSLEDGESCWCWTVGTPTTGMT